MEGTITFKANSAVQPYLCRYDPIKPYPTWKVYRGRKEICIPPRWAPGVGCVPMSLVYSGGVAFSPDWEYLFRMAGNDPPLPVNCSLRRASAVINYSSTPEFFADFLSPGVAQDFNLFGPSIYMAYGSRLFSQYTFLDSYSGIPAEDFIGISYDVNDTTTASWPGSSWELLVFGNQFFFPAFSGHVVSSIVRACSFRPGFRYDTNIVHPDYWHMPQYPVCESGLSRISSTVTVSNIKLLLGEKYRWTYTFTPPYHDNWWVSYPDSSGGLLPVYPVEGKTVIVP